jgi:hypothetical protein
MGRSSRSIEGVVIRSLRATVLFSLCVVVLPGCGNKPKLVPFTGKVTHEGKAVTGGSVWLHPEGGADGKPERMSGQLQIDGTFTAKTFPHGDGIPPGKYRVTLSPDLAARAGVPRCGDVAKTPWFVEVPESGIVDHTFEIR